jgi:hypothetical protein
MSMRWNGSRGCERLRSSSSYQASKPLKSSTTQPASSGSAGRNPCAPATVTASPAAVWTANGTLGSYTGRPASIGGCSGSAEPSPPGTTSPAMSAAGTA